MLFFYTYNGDVMKIYLDLLLLLNFFLDFILLLTTGIILKRKINIKFLTIHGLLQNLRLHRLS